MALGGLPCSCCAPGCLISSSVPRCYRRAPGKGAVCVGWGKSPAARLPALEPQPPPGSLWCLPRSLPSASRDGDGERCKKPGTWLWELCLDSRARVWIAPGGVTAAVCSAPRLRRVQGAQSGVVTCGHREQSPQTAPKKAQHLHGVVPSPTCRVSSFYFMGNIFTPCLQRNQKADGARCPSWPQHPARCAWQGQASAPSHLYTLWSSPHAAQHPETPAPSTQEPPHPSCSGRGCVHGLLEKTFSSVSVINSSLPPRTPAIASISVAPHSSSAVKYL